METKKADAPALRPYVKPMTKVLKNYGNYALLNEGLSIQHDDDPRSGGGMSAKQHDMGLDGDDDDRNWGLNDWGLRDWDD